LPRCLVLPGLAGGNSTNRYKFNGKEAVAELGPGMYDFGTRLQDAAIGRMHTVDAAAELFAHVSGYSFGLNNPVYNIDPTGDTTVPARNMEPFTPEKGATLLNEVVVKAKAFDTVMNTSSYVGQQIMEERTGFFDNLDQFLNGDRNYMGYQVDRSGVLTPYSTPVIAMLPDIGVGGISYRVASISMRSALAARIGKRGFTEVGYQFQKHFGRGSSTLASFVEKGAKMNPETFNKAGIDAFKAIWRAEGSFMKVGSFLEKRLPDGTGIRLQTNLEFKGFL
jgi:RHS repeat-associated protein